MAVTLQGSIDQYVGLSTDDKPVTTSSDTVPTGSTFFEVDTGRVARYDGSVWIAPSADTDTLDVLRAILQQLRGVNERLEVIADEL